MPRQQSTGEKPNTVNPGKTSLNRRGVLKSAVAVGAALTGNQSLHADGRLGKLVKIGQRARSGQSALKQRAASDYARSLQAYGGRLANPIHDLFRTSQNPDSVHFSVVVIGSGYGASIAAARISQRLGDQYRMCILERGKEWVPGTFPDTFSAVSANASNVFAGPTKGQRARPLGVFNLMMNDEVNILSGNGLGGGSLINASIALRPNSKVFQQQRWPAALNNAEVLHPYYDRVASALSLSRTPFDQTPKVRIRRQAAEQISRQPDFFDRSNISVMYDYRYLDEEFRNSFGMIQRPCTLCGDCTNGCNVGAKNTLAMNYLPVAKHNGTEIYTQVEVNSIEKCAGYYRVHMTHIEERNGQVSRTPLQVNSELVVVGAGSPASAAILLDSQDEKLQFSPSLGRHWSGNGDAIGFVTGLPGGNNIGGFGAFQGQGKQVGPTVQTSLNFCDDEDFRKHLLIQDSSIPRGAKNLFSALLRDPELDHSMVMLGMGHDESAGRLVKKMGRWQIKWEGLKSSAYRQRVFRHFEKLAKAHGGRYKRLKAFGDNLVTVHPLGGCGMSDEPTEGAVNHLGQVFDYQQGGYLDAGTGELAVHRGLYVSDGSVIPTALGVNPYMTIGAISERIANHIVNNPEHSHLFSDSSFSGS
ncbi:GMC family oxidoreductase N-terminal domain-containing protein [Mariniblastus sp.]|nr:GMC family oxidoreductase N-terminal domain-containing protein [Mariniblastus sp.]